MRRTALTSSLAFGVVWLTACGVSVDDHTPSPPQYSYSLPLGFTVRATTAVASGFMSTPELKTYLTSLGTATTYPVNQQISMSPSAGGDYIGRFLPTAGSVRLYTGCGFKLQHVVSSKFIGIFPASQTINKNVPGDPYAQHVMVGGIDAVFPTGGGATNSGKITTPEIWVSSYSNLESIAFTNGYDAPLVLTATQLTCTNGDCAASTPPYITNITLPPVPATLACGEYRLITFVCSVAAAEQGLGGEAMFTTNRGTVTVPFHCYPDQGG